MPDAKHEPCQNWVVLGFQDVSQIEPLARARGTAAPGQMLGNPANRGGRTAPEIVRVRTLKCARQ
jgi:hypothetical protein